MYWFVGDMHCAHNQPFIWEKRGFRSIVEHDETLIKNWNDKVSPNDHVYILGDLCYKRVDYALWLLHTLKGKKYLIRGNHDKAIKGECLKLLHLDVKYHELTIQDATVSGGKQLIVLCHYPFETWNKSHWGSFHLHSHTHGNLKTVVRNRLDVGVDVIGPAPISYEEIKERFADV